MNCNMENYNSLFEIKNKVLTSYYDKYQTKMKNLIWVFTLLTLNSSFAQRSEEILPKDAVTVISLNNIALLQKVSMDELISYDFMAELQSELFDGSTQGKTLKDSGIDFNQKMNIFYGKNEKFELSGFTFGISDKNKLFTVFDDFDRVEGKIKGVEYYNNYFNHLMIKGNSALLIRVDANQENLSSITDSIWYARGFESPFSDEMYDENGDLILDENPTEPILDDEGSELDSLALEDPTGTEITDDLTKNYYELRDSLETEIATNQLLIIADELFIKNIHLKGVDARFANQLTHSSDGIFYLDNARSIKNSDRLSYFKLVFPDLYANLDQLYSGNVILGDINLNASSIDIDVQANYGEGLGTIYQQLNSTKFDKSILKYIPKDNSGYFTYTIDLKKGYERAYDIIVPILEKEKNPQISANLLLLELIHEYVNTDAVFNTYKGNMFGTFNGVKRVKTKRIDFIYDEQTFEYQEKEIESEEDMPIFTLGFSTARPDIPEKVLRHFARMTSQFKNMGAYWKIEDAVLNSVPVYIINKNGLFIVTNDEDLALNHSNGYGAEAMKLKDAKKAKESGSLYAFLDLGKALNKLPKTMFTTKQNDVLESMRGKSGVLEIQSSETTKNNTKYTINYRFDGKYDNAGKYLLDLLNSAYVISK